MDFAHTYGPNYAAHHPAQQIMDTGTHEEHGRNGFGPAGCYDASRAAHDPESSRMLGILLAVVLCLPIWMAIFWLIL